MIARLGFLVAASIAAYAIKQVNVKRSSTPATKPSGNVEASSSELPRSETEDTEQFTYFTDGLKVLEDEEKEEVIFISGEINAALNNPLDFEDEIFPEFESFLSGQTDFPPPTQKYDTETNFQAEKDKLYEAEMANNAIELEQMRNLVKELKERELKHEAELLEYYGLKEQESDIVELQRQLKIKTIEIDMMNITINSLQAERKKLQEEVTWGASAKKDLEVARNKIEELQRQIRVEASQTKGQLLLLKQQVTGLQMKEEEAVKKGTEVEKMLKAMKELEMEVVELKRKNKELQHETRELIVKLDAAEAKVAALSNLKETDLVANVREEVNKLRHTNEDLSRQVEGLQMNRFSEVAELVYLRWVNACLRFELRNYQTPAGKISARDLNKNLSPRS